MSSLAISINPNILPESIADLSRMLGREAVSEFSADDIKLIWLAYNFARKSHGRQTRDSGELYIYHPLEVGRIVCNMGLDAEAISASFLHDVVEDTDTSLHELRNQFGDKIASLVDGVTKLTKYEFPDKERRDAAGIRKLFLAMISDVRVIIIKLADRLHNLSTLDHLPEQRRKNIALETLEIYAPIAERLGIWNIKSELEDTAFKYLQPQTYEEIAQGLASSQAEHNAILDSIIKRIKEEMSAAGYSNNAFEITGRHKHIYSIYKKLHTPKYEGKGLERIYDKLGIRIVVKSVRDCYTVLGIIHSEWTPVSGEFDDYIGMKLPSGYQSLHTAVRYDQSQNDIVEFQIRTFEMHNNAELGVAAHWRYKEKQEKHKRDRFVERKITWLRQMLEEPQSEDPVSFVALLRTDVLQDRVYAFTPRGDIIDLSAGSTAIDFAYHVHTDIGHRCRGARVNGKLVPLYQELKTGDQVEILTAKRGGPSRDWLNANLGLVKTQRARSKIKAWFKKQEDEQNLSQGRLTLERELQRLGISEINFEKMARELGFKIPDELFIAVGCGDLSINKVIKQVVDTEETSNILEITKSLHEAKTSTDSVDVVGLKGLLSSMARCCNPMPGDQIVGYITRGRGATIHRQDCPNVLRRKDKERLLQVAWGRVEQTFGVPITVKAYDRQGLMGDISTLLQNEGVNIADVSVNFNRSVADLKLVVEVRDLAQLSRVLTRIESLPNVVEAQRTRPG